MNKKPIIVITGPTASGKTELAISLAKCLNTEIINADSMQIYKGIDIISAAPSESEKKTVKHHLFGFKSLNDEYSVGDYVSDAERIISLHFGNKIPIICGGTGLYISSLINSIDFTEESTNEDIRKRLKAEMEELGTEKMHQRLSVIDPKAAESIHPNNKIRVIRALEVIEITGKTFTEYKREAANTEKRYNALVFALNYKNRDTLYDRINLRVDKMLENGMEVEAKTAISSNPSKTANAAIGLKEFKEFFDGETDLLSVVENIKQASRNYAKRQITWFKKMQDVNWIYHEDFLNKNEITNYCLKIIKERLNFEKEN